MTNSNQQQPTDPVAGHEIFAEVINLSKKRMTEMLVRMIESAQEYHNWALSDDDAARLVKLIKHKQRIICSSFVFQMNRNFADFKSADGSLSDNNGRHDWQRFGLAPENDSGEIEELERITNCYRAAFKEFDLSLLKRLQTCVRRSRANIYENPLQVKRLCEAFRYAIDSLSLRPELKIGLYQLFADRFIEALGPLYRSIDLYLLEQGMLPEIAPARIRLRSFDELSEADPPKSLNLNQSACLLVLLQDFKEKSRVSANHLHNYFPEMKRRFSRYGLQQYDEQIDQLNLIFKLIFEDEDLPAPIKQQLARLQIYIFITAVQEDGFLRRSTNPARRLLDGIISKEVEIAHNGNSELSGMRFIRDHIDSMASLQFITVDHYSEMLQEYQKFIIENETAIRRQRKIDATRKVLPLVKERLSEITQPLRVQGTPLILFEKVWLPLLVQIALQQGMDSEPWHKSIAMVQKQVWSLIPKNSPEEQAELMQVLPMVAHSLHRAMRSLKLAESLQQSLRDFLKLEQQNVAEQTARNIIEAKRKTSSLAAQSFALSSDDPSEFDAMMQTGVFQIPTDMLNTFKTVKPEPPKKINQVEALTVGEWVSFKEAEGSRLAKLAWKAEDSTLFIFVDREGKRVCEVDAAALSNQFETGAVSLSSSNSTDSKKSLVSFLKSL